MAATTAVIASLVQATAYLGSASRASRRYNTVRIGKQSTRVAAQPPHGFRGIQWANLNSWSGDTHAEEFVKPADGISRFAPVATPTPAATPQARQPDPPADALIDSEVQPPEPEGWVRWLRLRILVQSSRRHALASSISR
jgi:hypothetical protein